MKTIRRQNILRMQLTILCLLVCALIPFASRAQAQAGPVLKIAQKDSSVKFFVKASVALAGSFEKWDATLTFASTDVKSGVLNITIQADSVKTGSSIKDSKLKSKDFFYVEANPTITFKSKKLAQTGPGTFEFDGDFTVRGVTKPEKLTMKIVDKGTDSGTIVGTMAFDRKDFAMDKGIPLVKIADRVEVTVTLKGKRISGPPLNYQQ